MTRRSSVRAQAQEFFRDMVEDDRARGSLTKETPTPDPSPPLASLAGGGETTSLTARARALYEGSAVPVREIARLAGVSERTVYKYAARHGWKKRYATMRRGQAAADANRGRSFRPAPGFVPDLAPVRGAGGRFIRREDKSKPFAAGLKAADPAGHARATAVCADAERQARLAEAQAQAERWSAEMTRAIQAVTQARQDLAAHDAASKKRLKWSAPVALRGRVLMLSLKAALDWMEITVAAWERAALSSLESGT